MFRKTVFFFCLVVIFVISPLSVARGDAEQPLALAQNGQSAYTIALAQDAIPAERTAATELQSYLQQVTGVTLPIANENSVSEWTPQILVGAGSRSRRWLPRRNWAALGTEGIVIKTHGNNLVLAGGRPRGTLYAVYTFLEDVVGVRWWAPGETFVPKLATLNVAPQAIAYTPQIVTRSGYFSSLCTDPWFATRMKTNGMHQDQRPELGGHNSIIGWVHTFDVFLPPTKYFKDHPEWYSDVHNGGKPCTAASKMPEYQKSQLCLSNDEMRREFTKNAIEAIRKDPSAGMISISQNDNRDKSNHPLDVEIEKREGSPAGPMLHFVNKVAADIDKEFPGFQVETLAYMFTTKPPRYVRPRENVVIRLCTFDVDASRNLNSEGNKTFRDELLGWKKIAPRLIVWDYVTNFANVIGPHPDMNTLGPNMRFFAANNVVGLFEQGDNYSGGTGDFPAMRAWLLSHLMWNPALAQDKLMNEFLAGYYGPAAPHLRAYIDEIQTAFAVTGKKLRNWHPKLPWLTLEVMNSSQRHFDAAAEAVKDDPVLAARVRRERMALDHSWILQYKDLRADADKRNAAFEGPSDIKAFTAEFVRMGRELKIREHGEGLSFETYAQKLLAQ